MGARQGDTPDEAVIRNLIEDWAGAVRRKDFAGILRHHSPDIIMFDVPPPLQSRGIETYRQTWDLFFAASPHPPVFTIVDMEITAGESVAFVTALMRCVVVEAGKDDTDLDFRLTSGLRKIAGQWTVVHEHHSIPATQ